MAEKVTEGRGDIGELPVANPLGVEGRDAPVLPAGVEVVRRGEGQGLTFIQWAAAVLHNGLGRYDEALAAAQRSAEDPLEVRLATWGLVELIEAAARSGKAELAAPEPSRNSDVGADAGGLSERQCKGLCGSGHQWLRYSIIAAWRSSSR